MFNSQCCLPLWLQTQVRPLRWAAQGGDEEGAQTYSGAAEEAEEKPGEGQNQGTTGEEGQEGQRETRPQGKSKLADSVLYSSLSPFLPLLLNNSFALATLQYFNSTSGLFVLFLNVCLFSLAKVRRLWSHRTHEDQQVLPTVLSDQRPAL